MFYSLLSAEAVLDVFTPIAKWTIIGVAAALIIAGILVFLLCKKAFAKYLKYACTGGFAFLLALAVAFFAIDLIKTYGEDASTEVANLVLLPLLCFAAVCLLALTAFALTDKFRPTLKKRVAIIGVAVGALAFVAVLICLAVFYAQNIENDGYYNSDTATVQQLALYLGAVACIALLIGAAFCDKQKLSFDSRSLAYAGVCAGMSYALSYIKLWDMPQGGSVTLVSLLPLMVYAYIFGVKKGVFVGFVYGTLQAVQDPWIIHFAQFILDYPVAFAAAGLAGLLKNLPVAKKAPQVTFALGAALAGTMRFICHVLSGALAFEAYAAGQNVWIYSLAYNSYVFIDAALVIAAGILVFSSKAFLSVTAKLNKPKTPVKEENQ
ncbi:MAG: energy-coupled thiamine transporter ThiT [Clostridia bacterium]|nr:energy-coupled thiamine transporter ThiT [Clostridia bacterium]